MTLQIGDRLPEITSPPIGRLNIAYMTVAMRDPNLVHVEDDHAAKAGLPSVIAHGTFVTACGGAVVSRHFGADGIRRIRVDVTAPAFPQDVLRAAAVVVELTGDEAVLEITVTNQRDEQVGRGSATVELAAS